MQLITVLSKTMLVMYKIEGQNDRKEKLEEYATKLEQSLKRKQTNEVENNKRKLNEAKINSGTEEESAASDCSNKDIEVKVDNIEHGGYDISNKLKKVNLKAIEAYIKNKKNKRKQ